MEKRIVKISRKLKDGTITTCEQVRYCLTEDEKREKYQKHLRERRRENAAASYEATSWLPKSDMSKIMDAFADLMDSLEF